jgi:hypothetical protein
MKRTLPITIVLVVLALVFVDVRPTEAAQQLRIATGQITKRGDRFFYTVDVGFGQALYAVLSQPQGSHLDPYLRLYDSMSSNAKPFASNDDGAGGRDAMLMMWPLWPGRYYIEVSGAGTTTGAYSLLYGAFQPWGDTIATPNSYDTHYFYGRQGDTIWIQTLRDEDSTLDPYVTIVLPDGKLLTETTNPNGTADVLVTGSLPQTGTYKIYVSGERKTIGNYTLLVATYHNE